MQLAAKTKCSTRKYLRPAAHCGGADAITLTPLATAAPLHCWRVGVWHKVLARSRNVALLALGCLARGAWPQREEFAAPGRTHKE